MNKVENGQNVSVHYVGTFDDGTEFDNSRGRGEALSFQVGSEGLISGFNEAVVGMTLGEKKNVSLEPTQAYGEVNPEAVQTTSMEVFPEDVELIEGATIVGQNQLGQEILARVEAINGDDVTLDFNHPLAGKNLNFEIELVSID